MADDHTHEPRLVLGPCEQMLIRLIGTRWWTLEEIVEHTVEMSCGSLSTGEVRRAMGHLLHTGHLVRTRPRAVYTLSGLGEAKRCEAAFARRTLRAHENPLRIVGGLDA